METDSSYILWIFGIQHRLDGGFLDHKLLLGGNTYLTHCLIAHLLAFQIICMNIYLICDYTTYVLYVVVMLYCMY